MYFALLMGTFVVGIIAMLAMMGARQWKMGYRVAGGFSLVTCLGLTMVGGWLLLVYFDML